MVNADLRQIRFRGSGKRCFKIQKPDTLDLALSHPAKHVRHVEVVVIQHRTFTALVYPGRDLGNRPQEPIQHGCAGLPFGTHCRAKPFRQVPGQELGQSGCILLGLDQRSVPRQPHLVHASDQLAPGTQHPRSRSLGDIRPHLRQRRQLDAGVRHEWIGGCGRQVQVLRSHDTDLLPQQS